MKVKNLFNEKKKCAKMNLLNLEQIDWQPNLSIKDKKIANELAQCREERLFNQRQYQKEKNGSADHIRQERLANQHQYQNEKNVQLLLMKSENFMPLPRVHLLFVNQLWYKHCPYY